MKILVPFDFSEYAYHALEVAKKFAFKFGGRVTLYHCWTLGDSFIDSNPGDAQKKVIEDMLFDRLVTEIEKLEADGFEANYKLSKGSFIDNIGEHCVNNTYDLVIMGSHGASGKEEWILGSKTQKVLRKMHQNVLVVKDYTSSIAFKKALFATGLDKDDQKAFKYFLKFLEKIDCKEIHILTINTSSFFSQPRVLVEQLFEDFKKIAVGFEVEVHFVRDFSIDAGIRQFTEAKEIDIIGISNHVRHPIKRIFRGSNVEMLVNHSSVPVLSIDFDYYLDEEE